MRCAIITSRSTFLSAGSVESWLVIGAGGIESKTPVLKLGAATRTAATE